MGYKHSKEDIMKIGYEVFRKNGYHHVGINQILKEAGLPKGSFYNFFESKEHFAQQVITYYGDSNSMWLTEFFSQEGSPLQVIKDFYYSLIGYNEADDYASGCLVNNMSHELGRLNDELASVSNKYFLDWVAIIAAKVKEGQEAEEIREDYTAQELAEYLHASFYGSFSRMKLTRSRLFMDQWLDMSMAFITA